MLFNLIRPFITWAAIQSAIRHGLTAGGAILISKGLASSSDVTDIIGALMVLVGYGHSIWQKWQALNPSTVPISTSKIPLLLLPIFVGLALGLTACKSSGPQQVTYQTAATTAVTVEAAMNEWGAYVAANHPGTNAEMVVAGYYAKYQDSMAVVCDAGAAYSATGGTNSTAIAALQEAIGNSSQELTDLENAITSYGVHLQ
jgi:hypothetical protein